MSKSLILIIALSFGIGSLISCASAGNAANERASGGGAADNKPSNTAQKQAENKPAEDKKAAEKIVLWDFRKSSDEKREAATEAEADIVLKYLLGETWDQELGITSKVSGAFTKANAKETLYFVTGCKDEDGKFVSNMTCGHVGWHTDGRIAIYDGTTPVLKTEEALGYGILKVTDVNGDGVSEILSSSGYAQSGIQTESLALGQISGGKYQSIKGFSGYADDCAFGVRSSGEALKAVAAVISYAPAKDGKMPEFSEEYFRGICKEDKVDNSSWKKTTKKDFDAIYESLS